MCSHLSLNHTTLLAVVLMAAVVSAVPANTPKKIKEERQNEVKITATFYPLYIMLENITDGIPGVSISMLAPPNTGCLHDYELTTKDMKAITSCDILIANGAGMEMFLDRALEQKKGAVIVAAEGFQLVDDNPHVWVSPKGAAYEVNHITEKLAELDKVHAAQYKANGARYAAEIETLAADMHAALDKYAGSRIITFHEAFPYFAAEFKLNQVSVIEREPGTVPNAKELAQLIALIKEAQQNGRNISLFAEPQYSSSAADVIAAETGLKVRELDPCVTGTFAKDSYIVTMKKNLNVLKEALSETAESQ
jgi:zinc transport system substrate-binding protein